MKTFVLPYRPPFDWDFALDFLRRRQIDGVEAVSEATYARVAAEDGVPGFVTVGHEPEARGLRVTVAGPLAGRWEKVARRVGRVFDLDRDPAEWAGMFRDDPVVGPLWRRWPGVRIPGAWTPFEGLLRTVVGQQVSVQAATTVATRIAARTGAVPPPLALPSAEGRDGGEGVGLWAGLHRLFPEPEAVARADLSAVGMPGRRVAALQAAARRMAEGTFPGPEEGKKALLGLPGVGPWTAEFFALRAWGDGDAWPETDLILRRELARRLRGDEEGRTAKDAAARWRPFRAYAALLLWRAAAARQH